MKKIIDRLLGKKTKPLPSPIDISTVPLDEEQLADALSHIQHHEPQQLAHGCGQSVGKQRDHNEDYLFTFTVTIGGKGNNYPLGLFIIADGMGGHQYGEVASSTAVRALAGYILKRFHSYILDPSKGIEEPLQELMRAAINEAQRAVTQSAPGSGTTLTVALVLGQQMTIGHVGDSRAYSIRPDGRVETLTRDHSLVKRLEELGQITSDEAITHPQRNVLYRAVGQGDTLDADIFTAPFPQPGYLVLCSDGLWSVVNEDNLYKILKESSNLNHACQRMVTAANDAGGPDNISVIIIQLYG